MIRASGLAARSTRERYALLPDGHPEGIPAHVRYRRSGKRALVWHPVATSENLANLVQRLRRRGLEVTIATEALTRRPITEELP